MIKYVIKIRGGLYWRAYQLTTDDLQEAWTFNKEARAREHATKIELGDVEVLPVSLSFEPKYEVTLA